jgi:putative transposase
VKEQSILCSIAVIAYCLMPNYYHFVLRQDGDISIATFVQSIFNSYSKAFNRMWGRKGTLFESAFYAIHVETDEYLLHLCRYIHMNPVVAGLVKQPEEWAYSNFLEWIGRRNGTLIDLGFARNYFKTKEDYMRFVSEAPSKDMERAVKALSLESGWG